MRMIRPMHMVGVTEGRSRSVRSAMDSQLAIIIIGDSRRQPATTGNNRSSQILVSNSKRTSRLLRSIIYPVLIGVFVGGVRCSMASPAQPQ